MARTDSRLRFKTAAEAREEAERMEALRDDEVSSLREAGREGAADAAADRWNEEIRRVLGHARRLDERDAQGTPQPENVPRPPKRKPSSRRKTGSSSGGGSGSTRRQPSPLVRTARQGYSRSGAQAAVTGWGTLAWQIAGMTIGIALLTIFVSSQRGTGAFGAIANGLAGGLRLIVSPIDPLGKGAIANTVEQTTPTQTKPSGRVML